MRSCWLLLPLLVVVACGEGPSPPPATVPANATDPTEDRVTVDGRIGPDGVFQYPPGDFHIRFPAMPVHERRVTNTPSGPLVTEMFVHESADMVAYMVAYSRHEPTLLTEAGGTVLEVAMRGALDPLAIAEPSYTERVMINGMEGLRFAGDNGDLYIDSQVQILGDRLYRITVLAKGGRAPREAVDAFIGSFHYAPAHPAAPEPGMEDMQELIEMVPS